MLAWANNLTTKYSIAAFKLIRESFNKPNLNKSTLPVTYLNSKNSNLSAKKYSSDKNYYLTLGVTFRRQNQSKHSNTNYLLASAFLPAKLIVTMASIEDCKDVKGSTLEQADKLFAENKIDEVLTLLKSQSDWANNEQVLWRVARATFSKAKEVKEKSADEYKKLVDEAYEHVKKSLSIDDKIGMAHKWAAILLNESSTLKGTKERVLQVLNVREHMEKAIEYCPQDPTSRYLLGEWHYGCNQVSWIERKIASIAFGKLPEADMDKALECFEKAEEVDPDFYSKNKLMLAKTLIQMKRDNEKAVQLLKDVVSKYTNSEKWDDKEVSIKSFFYKRHDLNIDKD